MLRAALLDLYNGEGNRGIPMLRSILARYANVLRFDHFDVRARHEVPGADYDLYIFSGGPGNPLESGLPWCEPFYQLIDDLYQHNLSAEALDLPKKHVFFICHSFQMAMHHFKLGQVTERKKMSFGTYPVHKTYNGKIEPFFEGLPDPFYIADFRRYQVIQPNKERFKHIGAQILCLEKMRPHVHLERAIMAVRFTPEMIGTQFHPEADPEGMLAHFNQPERRAVVVEEYGSARYQHMIHDLSNPNKIQRTFDTIIPNFIEHAIESLVPVAE
jgi:homoserine O-succinyltransferase/O-acetyltransferase